MPPHESRALYMPMLWGPARGGAAKWKDAEAEGVGYRGNHRERDESPYHRDEGPYKGRDEGPCKRGDRRLPSSLSLQRHAVSWGSLFIITLAMLVCLFTASQLVDSKFAPAQCVEDNPFQCFLRRWVLLPSHASHPSSQESTQAQSESQAQGEKGVGGEGAEGAGEVEAVEESGREGEETQSVVRHARSTSEGALASDLSDLDVGSALPAEVLDSSPAADAAALPKPPAQTKPKEGGALQSEAQGQSPGKGQGAGAQAQEKPEQVVHEIPGQAGPGHVITDDKALFRRALGVTQSGGPRIAFLFMVRGPLPLAPLWARFFAGKEGKYAVYIHTMEGFKYKQNDIPAMFRRRQIHSKATKWGTITIIDAERRLLANALLDPRNTHFVLLSETCIPFYDFDFTFKYITESSTSFLKTTAPLNWWSQSMLPLVPENKLRKGSAWFALQRRHAALIVADEEFYAQFDKGWGFGHGFDEHYYQTLLTHLDPGGLANRSIMYAAFRLWKVHPIVYSFEDISHPFLESITNSTCDWNTGLQGPCFLFGRKFAVQALDPLFEHLPLTGKIEKKLPGQSDSSKEEEGKENQGPGNVCTKESDLLGRAVSRIHRGKSIAFMFLTPGQLPLAPLWADFFAGQEGKYSIFIHSPLNSTQMDDFLPDVFRERQIPTNEASKGTMVEVGAVRRLLAHAMLDSKNAHFVLLSESSIPVFGFEQTYKYIMESQMSFLEVNGKVSWWSSTLLPRIPKDHMRRGATWFVMWRKHAALLLKDVQYCKSFLYGWGIPNGASEHYYQTFLSRLVAQELANRTLEYHEPKEGAAEGATGALRSFGASDVTEGLLKRIKGRACTLAGAASPCFLFARQFTPDALEPLVRLLPVLGYGDTTQQGVVAPNKALIKEVGGVQQPDPGPRRDLCTREQSLMRVVHRSPKGSPAKVAFLFLTRGGLPLAPLWAEFFAGHDGKYSISVITQDPSLFNEQDLPPAFQGRQVPSLNVETAGTMAEMFAVRRLMVHALMDPKTSHVVLLSEWCIPLYSFAYTYHYITESQQSFLEVTRNITWWDTTMLSRVPKDHLRRGSMFVALSRFHAFILLKDTVYCKAFVYGWGASGAEASEHYYQTLLPRLVAPQLSYRGILYEEALTPPQGGDRKPRTFGASEVTAELVERMKEKNCTWNGSPKPCFLFARQFGSECLEPLQALRQQLYAGTNTTR